MQEFLKKLIANDTVIDQFTQDEQLIQQGLAPISALSNHSLTLQKANLLEAAKLRNWQIKAQELFSELSKNNINFLVFKGFAFTFLLYDNSHLRPYSDIDVIIDQADYEKTQSILLQLGYLLHPSRQGKFVSFQNSFYDNNSPQAVIDLHWQINNRVEFHAHFPFHKLYEKCINIPFYNVDFKALGFIHAFILGCFHYQAHRPGDRNHIWLYDLALMWFKMDGKEQKECIEESRLSQQSQIVLKTLKLINDTFANCLEIDFDLSEVNTESTDYYLKERKNKITDIRTRLVHIHGLGNKIKFISEYVFQKRDYVKRRYHLKSKIWVYFYYPRMWIEDFLKLFK